MWNWLNCYLSGRHDFGISCEPGTIFLRCIHCGKRSNGWEIQGGHGPLTPAKAQVHDQPTPRTAQPLPFAPRGVARQERSA